MSGQKNPEDVRTCKKDVGLSNQRPVYVCPQLIQQIQTEVPQWEHVKDTKIAGILIRALPSYDLSAGKEAHQTTVTLCLPGGKKRIQIPLRVENIGPKEVKLTLDTEKSIKFLPGLKPRSQFQI